MTITKTNIKKHVLKELETISFPMCNTRKNINTESTTSFVLGTVNYRGQKCLGGKTQGPSRYNKKYPELHQLCERLIHYFKPDFSYTTIQVNKNVECQPHIDKNNVGDSYIIALGDFTGGQLTIEGRHYNIKNRFKKFNGHCAHWVEPFEGTRYSIVYFTHTFKPPSRSLTSLTITREGIYQKDKLIKTW